VPYPLFGSFSSYPDRIGLSALLKFKDPPPSLPYDTYIFAPPIHVTSTQPLPPLSQLFAIWLTCHLFSLCPSCELRLFSPSHPKAISVSLNWNQCPFNPDSLMSYLLQKPPPFLWSLYFFPPDACNPEGLQHPPSSIKMYQSFFPRIDLFPFSPEASLSVKLYSASSPFIFFFCAFRPEIRKNRFPLTNTPTNIPPLSRFPPPLFFSKFCGLHDPSEIMALTEGTSPPLCLSFPLVFFLSSEKKRRSFISVISWQACRLLFNIPHFPPSFPSGSHSPPRVFGPSQ